MQQNAKNNMKLIIAAFVAIIIVAIGYFIYTQITRAGKVGVTVITAPDNAEVLVDSKKVGNGKAYLVPNHTYTIKVHKDGFADYTQKQYISSEEDSIAVSLTAVSDEAKKWAENHQNAYLAVEAQAGVAANKEGENFSEKNPITDALPYENLIYSIGYRSDPSDSSGNSIIISIEAPEGARNAAVQQIRDLGYDPTDYKIEFNDYKSPFAL